MKGTYNEMTTTDLIAAAHSVAHPSDNPSAEHAALIDELAARLARLSEWRERMEAVTKEHGTAVKITYCK